MTGLFAAMMTLVGVMDVVGPKPVVDSMIALGYPLYFMRMLGVAKLLGAVALIAPPKLPTLREWAYAGFAFDSVGRGHLARRYWRGLAHPPTAFRSRLAPRVLLSAKAADRRASGCPC